MKRVPTTRSATVTKLAKMTTTTPRRSARKRKSADSSSEISVGTQFVKRFRDGQDSACYLGLVVERRNDTVTVVYEDNDKETIDVREVLNWRRIDLTSSSTGEKVSTMEEVGGELHKPTVTRNRLRRDGSSSWTTATAATETDTETSPSSGSSSSGSLSSSAGGGSSTAMLQLTLLSGVVAMTVTDMYLPLLIRAAGFDHWMEGGHASEAWFGVMMALFLNVSGAFMDGAAAVVEEQASYSHPGAAAVASCLRGGFLSAYTSFTQMAVDAGEGQAVDGPGGWLFTKDWRGAVSFLALSVGLGSVAFVAGRAAARLALRNRKDKDTKKAAQKKKKEEEDAEAVARALLWGRGGCVAVAVASLALALLSERDLSYDPSAADSTNDALELAVGMPLTALGVFVGNALGATAAANGAMSACICAAKLLFAAGGGSAAAVLGPGASRAALAFFKTAFDKFCGSFCGSGSAFCGTAGDPVTALTAGEGSWAAAFGLSVDATSALFVAAVAAATVGAASGGSSGFNGLSEGFNDEAVFGIAKAALVASVAAAGTGYMRFRPAALAKKDKTD